MLEDQAYKRRALIFNPQEHKKKQTEILYSSLHIFSFSKKENLISIIVIGFSVQSHR